MDNNGYVKFLWGEKGNLNSVPIVKGQILFTVDEKIFYLDIDDPNNEGNIIRVSTYPEEIVEARKQTTSEGINIYNSLGERINAIPYINFISLESEVSIPYINDKGPSTEDTYSSSKIEELMSWGQW